MAVLSEWASKQRLGDALPCPLEMLASSRAEAEKFAASVHAPIVAKASGVAHKTEEGLVRLGLGPADIGAVWEELTAAGDGSVLLAEQLEAELELIVGAYRDASFGPLVTIGIGGIAAEIYADVVAILAPPEAGEVETAVAKLAGHRLLSGIRGGPPVDLEALSNIITVVAETLTADPEIAEIDCNPVMVCKGKPIVADALVVIYD